MNAWLKGIGNLLFGKLSESTAEYRVFNMAILISIVFSLMSIVLNTTINFPYIINISLIFGLILLTFIYIQSRFFNRKLIGFYIIIVLIILSIAWCFSDGLKGSTNYIYIVAYVIFLSISHPKRHLLISILLLFNLLLLHSILFYRHEWVHSYVSEKVQATDLILTFAMVLITAGLVYSTLRKNYQNEKIKVEIQKTKIENQHRQITDSIFYAEEIQSALIQDSNVLHDFFKESFMVWFPKDIISGDFYFFSEIPNSPHKKVIVVADCTGHGVPGALLTMLGISYLKEIISRHGDISANAMLNFLCEKFIDSLKYKNRATDNIDGMELALCIVDKSEKTLDFSGANRPLYLVREGKLNEYKSNRFPVGIQTKNPKPFVNEIIKLETNDTVYLFTDGYPDQFGEVNSRKFYIADFKKMIKSCHALRLNEQGKIFNMEFLNWKGVKDQIDDVLVIGFKPLS